MTDEIKHTVDTVKNFIIDSMSGVESALYKSTKIQNHALEHLKQNETKSIIFMLTIKYLNICYRSLILKDDNYVIDKFNEMIKYKKHSFICLLNIYARVMQMIIEMIDRSHLEVDSYEKYMDSYNTQLLMMIGTMEFEKLVSHDCKGIDITICDPDKPLFQLK